MLNQKGVIPMRRILAGTAGCRELPVRYYLLVEEQVNETETYGIGVEYGEDRAEVPDITSSQKGVFMLLDTMIRGNVTPVTLRDVAEDWLLA